MKIITSEQVAQSLPHKKLIERLRHAFQQDINVPIRHHHEITKKDESNGYLLLMPAWINEGKYGGIKLVNVLPDNHLRDLPAITASYLLFDNDTGAHLAFIDAQAITSIRTACASALAADYLARKDANRLLLVGAGKVSSQLVQAYSAIRELKQIQIWNKTTSNAERLKDQLQSQGFKVSVADDLELAVSEADMISCATLSQQPIIKGEWLKNGQHVDLIGSFTPDRREADDAAITKAKLFIDTQAALIESGDLVIPLENDIISDADIQADLHELCMDKHKGRESDDDITLFKNVGTALEDLAAAILIYEQG